MTQRVIEFRGSDGDDWVYGDLIHTEKGNINILMNGSQYQVKPETVGQFTGLRDKHGNKIFEGDIVQYSNSPLKYAIKYNDGCFEMSYEKSTTHGLYFCDIDFEYIEIIGNVFDNTELINNA